MTLPDEASESLPAARRLELGPKTQTAYEELVNEMATIRMRKVLSYGEDGYKDPEIGHSMMINYSDLHRKFIRIKAMVLRELEKGGSAAFSGEEMPDGEALRDAYLDLANYALMGVQLLDTHRASQHD